MNRLIKGVVALGAAGVGGLGYASLIERNAFVLRYATLPVLPPGQRTLRVLHVTDLHLMPGQRRKAAWIRALAEHQPDLVVNTGDNIADRDSVAPLLWAFEPLFDVPGVFVLGSNDYFAPRWKNPAMYLTGRYREGVGHTPRLPTDDLVAGMRAGGWTDLSNARTRMTVDGAELDIVGVDDPHLEYDRYDLVTRRADPTATLTMGVTHAPYQRVLDAMTADGAGLVVAGHTHGGQLCLPWFGALVTNCDLDRRRAKGVSRWWPGAGSQLGRPAPPEAAWLTVSAGLGTAPTAPVRFACRPEASLLTLVPAAA